MDKLDELEERFRPRSANQFIDPNPSAQALAIEKAYLLDGSLGNEVSQADEAEEEEVVESVAEGFEIEPADAVPSTNNERRRDMWDELLVAFLDSKVEVAKAKIKWSDDNPRRGQIASACSNLRTRARRDDLPILVFQRQWEIYLALESEDEPGGEEDAD